MSDFTEDWTALLHGAQFASNGKCFTGYVTTPHELEQVLESFKKATGWLVVRSLSLVGGTGLPCLPAKKITLIDYASRVMACSYLVLVPI